MLSDAADAEAWARAGKTNLDVSVPHSARLWNYLLGGKDNFAADRAAAEALLAEWPGLKTVAQEDRAFLRRVIGFLASEDGGSYSQWLDIGTGLPQVEATHEVAQEINPAARVVYVDNDPLVLAHARALLTSSPKGKTSYIDADLRAPSLILDDPDLHATLDLSKPVVLVLGAILHLLDEEWPYAILRALKSALAPGSALVVTHGSLDKLNKGTVARLKKKDWLQFVPRTRDEIVQFFEGWDLVAPGVTMVSRWRRDLKRDGPPPRNNQLSMYGGVAIKPR